MRIKLRALKIAIGRTLSWAGSWIVGILMMPWSAAACLHDEEYDNSTPQVVCIAGSLISALLLAATASSYFAKNKVFPLWLGVIPALFIAEVAIGYFTPLISKAWKRVESEAEKQIESERATEVQLLRPVLTPEGQELLRSMNERVS